MAETYDLMRDNDFDDIREMVRGLSRKLGEDAIDLITTAAAAGWKIVVSGPESVALIAPGEPSPKRIHLSVRNKNKFPLRKMASTIRRYGDPQRVAIIDAAATSDMEFDAGAYDLAVRALASEGPDVEVMIEKPEEKPVRTKEKKKPKPAPTPFNLKTAAEKKVRDERHIISEQPALMHYSLTSQGGRSYPSRTTIERRWSDGTVDYACAVPTCDKTSDNRLSFRGAHWAMHVRKGEAEKVDMEDVRRDVVDDPSYTEPAWTRQQEVRSARTRALAEVLRSLDVKKMSAEELAEFIMDWIASQGGGTGGGITEPLTPEQVIDRIRVLVDRGTYAEQREQIEKMQEDLAQMQMAAQDEADRADAAEARAVKAESTLQALGELVSDAVQTTQDSGTIVPTEERKGAE